MPLTLRGQVDEVKGKNYQKVSTCVDHRFTRTRLPIGCE